MSCVKRMNPLCALMTPNAELPCVVVERPFNCTRLKRFTISILICACLPPLSDTFYANETSVSV